MEPKRHRIEFDVSNSDDLRRRYKTFSHRKESVGDAAEVAFLLEKLAAALGVKAKQEWKVVFPALLEAFFSGEKRLTLYREEQDNFATVDLSRFGSIDEFLLVAREIDFDKPSAEVEVQLEATEPSEPKPESAAVAVEEKKKADEPGVADAPAEREDETDSGIDLNLDLDSGAKK